MNKELPEGILNCGGLIGRIADYTMSQSFRPCRELSVAGAMAWVAHCMGRRYRLDDNTRPNIYLLGLGWSGTGKSQPRDTNARLAKACGMTRTMSEDFGSGEALQDELLNHAKVLSQWDEVDNLFTAMRDTKNNVAQKVSSELLKSWERSKNFLPRRKLAKSIMRKDDNTPDYVSHPHLTLFATGVTSEVYKSFNGRMGTNGFVARLMVIDGGKRGQRNEGMRFAQPPGDIITDSKIISGHMVNDCPAEDPKRDDEPIVIGEDSKATARRLEVCAEFEKHYDNEEDGAYNAIWNRATEKLRKISMILATSDKPSGPIIMPIHIDAAKEFVEYSNNMILDMIGRYAAETDYDDLQKRIIRILEKGITCNRAMLIKLHIKNDDLREAMETLQKAGKIIFCTPEGEEKPEWEKGISYMLA